MRPLFCKMLKFSAPLALAIFFATGCYRGEFNSSVIVWVWSNWIQGFPDPRPQLEGKSSGGPQRPPTWYPRTDHRGVFRTGSIPAVENIYSLHTKSSARSSSGMSVSFAPWNLGITSCYWAANYCNCQRRILIINGHSGLNELDDLDWDIYLWASSLGTPDDDNSRAIAMIFRECAGMLHAKRKKLTA